MSSSNASPSYPIEHLEDFTRHEWCQTLLSDPSITKIMKRRMSPHDVSVSNSFFTTTLFTDGAIRAFLSMFRPGRGRSRTTADAQVVGDALVGDKGSEPRLTEDESQELDTQDDLDEPESLLLVSLGKALDGGINRLHGGVTATLLDQVMGVLISYVHANTSATAELTIKYKKAIQTPAVLLCRARIVREVGRWIEVVGWIEDGRGVIYAEGKGSFVKSKVAKI
ncbi:uncharacterized protein BDR25DRAFT_304655 [Lindgomyces ingoldianus]|uniref:Uncharacterized protein n=1 Tax=Lindgomyces ingoldianus TaxID=673940 RepID=A0ACB6QQ87_9PLEO|nr:uncharacterized protein BDR25DRAFT_304655 [Lindgomyces ingoldianus]KAF2469153.1 hypothetical protein BDR25DRAFT_304655 [Lindgomyces ingoldianus]